MNLTLDEATPLAVCKYIRENIDKTRMLNQGFHFNAVVNNVDFFSGHIYSDNGDMYWGTIQQRSDSIDNSQIYKYFSSGGADTVSPFSNLDDVICSNLNSNASQGSNTYSHTATDDYTVYIFGAFGGTGGETGNVSNAKLTTNGEILDSFQNESTGWCARKYIGATVRLKKGQYVKFNGSSTANQYTVCTIVKLTSK